jgi:hypothetical protein
LRRVRNDAAQTQESAVFPINLSRTQVNRSLTDKALRTSLLGVKTGAKPGQTKEMVRDLAFVNVGRSQVLRVDPQGGKIDWIVRRPVFPEGGRWDRALA